MVCSKDFPEKNTKLSSAPLLSIEQFTHIAIIMESSSIHYNVLVNNTIVLSY